MASQARRLRDALVKLQQVGRVAQAACSMLVHLVMLQTAHIGPCKHLTGVKPQAQTVRCCRELAQQAPLPDGGGTR